MEPISNIDRLVVLLRQHLAESGDVRRKATRSSGPSRPATPNAVRALAEIDSVDERRLRRALVQKLLAERLGEGLVNDARFQTVVDRVLETLQTDPEGERLLARVVADLKAVVR